VTAVPYFAQRPDWALVVPMANEEPDFEPFIKAVTTSLDIIGSGVVYFVVDNVSKDRTLDMCRALSAADSRFRTIWAPENRNVVDAYISGYRAALAGGHAYIIEMDAGLSHDPAALPTFLGLLAEGYECVYGSRFLPTHDGGTWSAKRKTLSLGGTFLANLLLGTKLHDMTSGYQGFSRTVVGKFAEYPLRSRAHFYQTELRYLLRNYKSVENAIVYDAPSPSVSSHAVRNAFAVLIHYTWRRVTGRATAI
jgi:dolichol-phosphate mannosyltransferase